MDYTRFCFVIMPFNKKKVGDREIDFDWIYDNVFKPAISAVKLPEGGTLEPRRTDKDFATAHISQDMFEYLEYSRIAVADLSGLNPNVLYELGVRHRALSSGTIIFRMPDTPIPFDINQIKAFPYEYEPTERLAESIQLITRTLEESLVQNRLDSPVRIALRAQKRDDARVESLIREAEEAIRHQDPATALQKYEEAIQNDGQNALLRMRAGLLYRDHGGRFGEALKHFVAATAIDPQYGEAWRERGIAENKLEGKREPRAGLASLERAVERNPSDFDALASLGGVLKRAGDLDASIDAYRRATEVSLGHSYPLLNWLTLRAVKTGSLTLSIREKGMLSKALRSLTAQVAPEPAYNTPWTVFDYAQAQLFLGNPDQFIEHVGRGIMEQTADWQPGTFADTLDLLVGAGIVLPGLAEGIAMLRAG
jgi:tetratricopeptide (TPR) repeat protein